MKKHILLILCLCFFLINSVTAYAKPKLGGFTELSEQAKQDTVTALVNTISADLHLQSTPSLYFYNAPDWHIAASYYCGLNYIYINMSTFNDITDADAANETVEYHLVKLLAHELRHDYQYEHQFDNTEYGIACLNGFNIYHSYNGDLSSYYAQFIEADAVQWATEYADNYFKR